jgi:hypothetical protein
VRDRGADSAAGNRPRFFLSSSLSTFWPNTEPRAKSQDPLSHLFSHLSHMLAETRLTSLFKVFDLGHSTAKPAGGFVPERSWRYEAESAGMIDRITNLERERFICIDCLADGVVVRKIARVSNQRRRRHVQSTPS